MLHISLQLYGGKILGGGTALTAEVSNNKHNLISCSHIIFYSQTDCLNSHNRLYRMNTGVHSWSVCRATCHAFKVLFTHTYKSCYLKLNHDYFNMMLYLLRYQALQVILGFQLHRFLPVRSQRESGLMWIITLAVNNPDSVIR